MKYLIIHIVIVLFAVHPVFSNPQAVLQKANNAYSEGDYQHALQLYDSLVNLDYQSLELFYNLGNAHYKLNHIPAAILYYEKALLLSPNDERVLFNLQQANSQLTQKVDALPDIFILDWYQRFTKSLKTDVWAYFSVTFFWIFLISGAVFLYSKTSFYKKIGFVFAILFFGMSLSTGFFAQNNYKLIHLSKNAIIFESSVTAQSSPGETGTDLFTIHEGLKVQIIDLSDDWVEIKLPDGKVGWLPADAVRII